MDSHSQTLPPNRRLSKISRLDDVLLLGIMAVLAACGLIYEYLLSHYAGRVLGALEAAIYTMIGLMIVAMGIGAFTARKIRCAYTGFALLELAIALCGALAILVTAAIIGFSQQLPLLIASNFEMPPDQIPEGGWIAILQKFSEYLPYFWGIILGLMVGMEIPLIARVRQSLCSKELVHNAGTIYGADYIGAGIGAFIWVSLMLSIDIQLAAALTASFNLLAGFVFIWRFWHQIRRPAVIVAGHIVAGGLLLILAWHGPHWEQDFNNMLYKDKVIFAKATRFQQLTFTERLRGSGLKPVYSLYINGRLQFSSQDEHIYHAFLIHPTLAASARHNNILIIGGGDGLGLRQVLRWNPQSVTLMDLDHGLVDLFKNHDTKMPKRLSRELLSLNGDSFNDPRVKVIFDDAFNGVEKLIKQQKRFDAIIVDLPDPSHPDLNKLYSDLFYRKLKELLSNDGALTVQSTSPYHAAKAFISIKKTLTLAGFNAEQYHHNVPSFGEWGWTIATLSGLGARERLDALDKLPIDDNWLTLGLVKGAFEFPKNFYAKMDHIKPNRIGSLQLYHYHQQAWVDDEKLVLF